MRLLRNPASRLAILTVLAGLLGILWAGEGLGWYAPQTPVARTEASAALQASAIDSAIGVRQEALRRSPGDALALAELGELYLAKARITSDPSWYDKADAVLAQAIARRPDDARTAIALGELALARHRFADALGWGERSSRLAPELVGAYGVMADALIELGNHGRAADVIQAMVDRKPALASYARVSYARELYGDLSGAIAAMELAAEAGTPGTESRSWALVQAGHLHFLAGMLDEAAAAYRRAEAETNGYHAARAGLARIAAARMRYDEAIALLGPVTLQAPLPEYVILLGDVYAAAGRLAEAGQQYGVVRAMNELYRASGVDVDLELALFDLDHEQNVEQAFATIARLEAERPSLKVQDALAWAYYRTGDDAAGLAKAREALRLGTPDPLALYHAGKLAARSGQTDEARGYFERALALNPRYSVLWADDLQRSYLAVGGGR
ncbi:MAG: tetratricopeptide repeat protein [Dehalococcoidia bacterium]